MRGRDKRRLSQRESEAPAPVIFDGPERWRKILDATLLDLVFGVGVRESNRRDKRVFTVNRVALQFEDVAMPFAVPIMLAQQGRGIVAFEQLAIFTDPFVEPVAVNLELFAAIDEARRLRKQDPTDKTTARIFRFGRQARHCED